jgi:hypothetical protein
MYICNISHSYSQLFYRRVYVFEISQTTDGAIMCNGVSETLWVILLKLLPVFYSHRINKPRGSAECTKRFLGHNVCVFFVFCCWSATVLVFQKRNTWASQMRNIKVRKIRDPTVCSCRYSKPSVCVRSMHFACQISKYVAKWQSSTEIVCPKLASKILLNFSFDLSMYLHENLRIYHRVIYQYFSAQMSAAWTEYNWTLFR